METGVKWHELEVKDTLKRLRTSEKGLGGEEANSRLRKFGYNEIRKEKGISRFGIFLSQFKSFLILILIAATIFSFLIGEFVDAIAILVILLINAVLGFIQEYKAEKTIEALKKLSAPEAIVMRNGRKERIDSKLIVPGDVVILEEGSRIPADIRIIRESELKIDESILTGESTPVTKDTGIVKTKSLPDMKDMLFMGTLVTYGRGAGVVVGTGSKTEMGKIAEAVQEEKEETTPLQKKLDRFGKRIGIIILIICVLVIAIGLVRGGPLSGQPITNALIVTMVITGIALAVAAVPEGLPAVITITLALGLQKLAKHNALIRKLPAVETLGSTTIICADKTGTLTKNEMTVSDVWYFDKYVEVTGEGYEPEGKFLLNKKEIDGEERKSLTFLLQTASLCTNASLEKRNESYGIMGDPTEGAIVVAAQKIGFEKENLERMFSRINEIPFSSERKMMTTINKSKEGKIKANVKGAPEVVLEICDRIKVRGKIRKMTSKEKNQILEKNHEMTNKALRVLAVAYKDMKSVDKKSAEKNLIFLGLVGMIDPAREEALEGIKECFEAGIKTVMITGDHKNTAIAIAKELGIMEEKDHVLTGSELDSLSDKEFEGVVRETAVYARVDPMHKLRIVDALKKKGDIIAMTGDGVNDAPALKKADIGIAMGIKGTDVSKEASDMILRDDNFVSIVKAVRGGRAIYDNMKKFIQYLLSSNVGEVFIVFLAMLLGIGYFDTIEGKEVFIPILGALHLLWINILTDMFPALALGVDPESPGIMRRPPRDPKESILTKPMFLDTLFFGTLMCIGTLFLFSLYISSGVAIAITVAFTAVVMFEMVRVESVRTKYRVSILSNKKLLLAIGISVALQLVVVYTLFLQPVFKTTSIGLLEWGYILLVSAVIFIIMWAKNKIIKEKPWD
jgi:Ca2+-transporting ATPase